MKAPFVTRVTLKNDERLTPNQFPGNLAFTNELQLELTAPVTFFVGENGSGKSTLLEAMAVVARLPISGGGLNELSVTHATAERSLLAKSLRLSFRKQPRDRYFFRAEAQLHFASLLEQRRDDPDFNGNPFSRYGSRSLLQMSHGEAFLSIMQNRFENGLFLMDEPESALSPQRQLTLLAMMQKLVKKGDSQFIVATHSPILLTYPGASIVSFDHGALENVKLEDTSQFQITRDILNHPEMYWRHLTASDIPD